MKTKRLRKPKWKEGDRVVPLGDNWWKPLFHTKERPVLTICKVNMCTYLSGDVGYTYDCYGQFMITNEKGFRKTNRRE